MHTIVYGTLQNTRTANSAGTDPNSPFFYLQESSANKIETIMSEIDWTQKARARETNGLLYFDLQGTIFKK